MAIIAFDIGGTNIQFTVGDPETGFHEQPTQKPINSVPTKQIKRHIEELQQQGTYDIEAVSIATAGPIAHDSKSVKRIQTTRHGTIQNIQFGEVLSQMGIDRSDIYIANDANAAVLGEYTRGTGTDRSVSNLLYVTFSTGIGVGALQDGHVHRGATGNAGKIGTYPLAPSLKEVTAKTEGCWEELCGGKGIPNYVEWLLETEQRETILKKYDHLSPENVYQAAKDGDQVAEEYVRERIGELNSRGVAITALNYGPEIITIGGSIALNNPALVIDPIRENFERYYEPKYGVPDIRLTDVGAHIELYGALELPAHRASEE